MEQFDPRIDDYIAKSPAYAQPILIHLRELIHMAAPGIVEAVKWGCPHFDYKGAPAISMAAFKAHLGFNFWKRTLMDDPAGIFKPDDKSAGNIGKISSLADLPPDEVLIAYIRNAAELNEKGIKLEPKKAAPKKDLTVPDYLIEAFKANTKAMQNFEQMSYSCKKEYLEWLTEAKTEATRTKRLETMLEWVTEGKTRHWKYK